MKSRGFYGYCLNGVRRLQVEVRSRFNGVSMAIIVKLDEMMAKRKVRSNELAVNIDLTEANLSILKTGKARAIRFSTLEALCRELNCQPGDLLAFEGDSVGIDGQ